MPATILRDKDLVLVSGTTAQRPATPTEGMFRYNTDSGSKVPEYYNGTRWVQFGKRDGSSPEHAALSGWHLKQSFGSLSSGYYWIQSDRMPNPLQMYVNMTRDGGGYDFYAFDGNGTSVNYSYQTHSGTALGLDLVYPRSKEHWIAMREFVNGVLGKTGSAFNNFFLTCAKITQYDRRPNGVAPEGGYTGTYGLDAGNYTSFIMRDPVFYGTGAPDWKVPDGGRWWLRDTTHAEPNGDYDANGLLSTNGGIGDSYNGGDINFNDGGAVLTGTSYLVSTNIKP
jgi:hypothetical protein